MNEKNFPDGLLIDSMALTLVAFMIMVVSLFRITTQAEDTLRKHSLLKESIINPLTKALVVAWCILAIIFIIFSL